MPSRQGLVRRVACSVVVITLVSTTGCGVVLNCLLGAPFGARPARKDFLTLLGEAEEIVWPNYPNAIVIEAQGSPSSGQANRAGDVNRWVFVFADNPQGPEVGTVLLDYARREFGQPVYVPEAWFGTVYETLPRQIGLAEAIQYMRDAGHTAPFTSVTVREPLTFPPPGEALYAFSLPGRFVLVGALTGEVTVEIPQE